MTRNISGLGPTTSKTRASLIQDYGAHFLWKLARSRGESGLINNLVISYKGPIGQSPGLTTAVPI